MPYKNIMPWLLEIDLVDLGKKTPQPPTPHENTHKNTNNRMKCVNSPKLDDQAHSQNIQ